MKRIYIAIIAIQLISCKPIKAPMFFNDFDSGINTAKKKETNIFIVFDVFGSPTDYVDKILEDKEITKLLRHYVIVRLRCDDRMILYDNMTVGKFNSNLQKNITGETFQPMFCFLDDKGNKISPPLGYSKKEVIIEYILKHSE